MQVHDGRQALEAARDLRRAAPRAVALDLEREVGEQVEGAHRLSALGRLEPRHQLLEPQLLEPAADRVELAGAVLDQVAALLDEVERLAQAGVAGVEPADDLLDPRDRDS